MRHYVVEGRKDMLSGKYGFTYRPDHILNGDFRGSLEPWATNGAVRADSFAGFAKASQNRWGGNGGVGDTFAVLSRGKDSFATVSQKAKGLVPGRKYRLRYSTFDVKDACRQARQGTVCGQQRLRARQPRADRLYRHRPGDRDLLQQRTGCGRRRARVELRVASRVLSARLKP